MPVPVIMYHTIGRRHDNWLWSELTTPVEYFEKQIELLSGRGYRSISLDELRAAQADPQRREDRRVVLTFDDGYLDNWVYAYPLLKRLGWQGAVYVNPEFIDPGDELRLNLEDVWTGRCSLSDLPSHGFLNRAELRALQDSGVLEIASHSMSHTWYPTGPEIVDYCRPGTVPPWLAWNARPERKFAYLGEDQSSYVDPGTPIHAAGRSLGIRRYLPDPRQAPALCARVQEGGGAAFFTRGGWKDELDRIAAEFTEQGRFETDEEMMARFRREIFESKAALEEITGHEVRHFCWPGGAYNTESWPLAEEAGYETICVARRDSARWTADDPRLVRRIGSQDFISFVGKTFANNDPEILYLTCEVTRGRSWQRWPLRLHKLRAAVAAGFKSRQM